MRKHNGNGPEDQNRRLRLKTQHQRLRNLAVCGAGLSPWESEVLSGIVEEVYFSDPEDRALRSGQIRYECVSRVEGAGKPLQQCELVTVILTLFHEDDESGGPVERTRARRIMRLTEEAREQGGLLSQEDLAKLLLCGVRTIRRHIRRLRDRGILVPTRGQEKDIGPGVTHRGVVLKLWMEGHEAVEVARRTQHSLHAVERYIQHFSRVVFLRRKGFGSLQIALTVGISSASTDTYLEIYHEAAEKKYLSRRFDEMDIIGAAHYDAEDEKKGAPSPRTRAGKCGRKQP